MASAAVERFTPPLGALAEIVGAPVELEELKHKTGRRVTMRVNGPRRSAILKMYASGRAPIVARRISALAACAEGVIVPEVLLADAAARFVVLSDVPGEPMEAAVDRGDLEACRRVGAALGAWHASSRAPDSDALATHTVRRELEILRERCERAKQPGIARRVRARLEQLANRVQWDATTVVHRDLYESQILVGDRIGLIDLDDAALGPPELDIGNLLAHLELRGLRSHVTGHPARAAITSAYQESGPRLDCALLDDCTELARLRLACIHGLEALLDFPRP